jgi:hypothetical protein
MAAFVSGIMAEVSIVSEETGGSPEGGILSGLRATRDDYAVAPIIDSFNWPECLRAVDRADWYIVAFRSRRAPGADDALLTELDERAHDEAIAHTGLIHYFAGELDAERRCLSFCVWEDRSRAAEAAGLPRHREAIQAATTIYTSYVLERYRLSARAGDVQIEEIEPPQQSEALSRA